MNEFARPHSRLIFDDRVDAGRQLAARLKQEGLADDIVVLGLPRGGLPVAVEVATALHAPVDVLLVRKIGAPFNPELAVGSIAMGGIVVHNPWILDQLGLDDADLAPIIEREREELARRERVYRGDRPWPELAGKIVVLVDDGAATGATMRAAVASVRTLSPARIVVALPTSSSEAADRLSAVADDLVVLSIPEPYFAVGQYYLDFGQLSDEDVCEALANASQSVAPEPDTQE
ncbi:MAG: phosphoribosyltransferase family protein [Gammaproteobacteria bacterium]|jgi:predicted phosphoribosyltransferase